MLLRESGVLNFYGFRISSVAESILEEERRVIETVYEDFTRPRMGISAVTAAAASSSGRVRTRGQFCHDAPPAFKRSESPDGLLIHNKLGLT